MKPSARRATAGQRISRGWVRVVLSEPIEIVSRCSYGYQKSYLPRRLFPSVKKDFNPFLAGGLCVVCLDPFADTSKSVEK